MTARVSFSNHAAVRVRRSERERIRAFYREVLGCTLTRQFDDKDDIRVGDDYHIGFLYAGGSGVEANQGVTYAPEGALTDEEFRKAIFLELKTDDVEGLRRKPGVEPTSRAAELAHRFVGSDYNAGAGAPVAKDIGIQPVAITTARVRFSF